MPLYRKLSVPLQEHDDDTSKLTVVRNEFDGFSRDAIGTEELTVLAEIKLNGSNRCEVCTDELKDGSNRYVICADVKINRTEKQLKMKNIFVIKAQPIIPKTMFNAILQFVFYIFSVELMRK